MIYDADILRMIFRVANKQVSVIEDTNDPCAIIRTYSASDGWKFAIFNDCGQMDYFEWVQAPSGERVEFYVYPEDQPELCRDGMLVRMPDQDALAHALNWDPSSGYTPYYASNPEAKQ